VEGPSSEPILFNVCLIGIIGEEGLRMKNILPTKMLQQRGFGEMSDVFVGLATRLGRLEEN
jgi:hypothetical protein